MADTELAEAEPPAEAETPAEAGAAAAAAQAAEEAGQDAPPQVNLERSILRGVGTGLLLLAIFLLGFAAYLYGLSGVQEARTQTILYTKLQAELAGVQGEAAPLGPTAAGAPVAILNIPSIGVRDLVLVQGTTPGAHGGPRAPARYAASRPAGRGGDLRPPGDLRRAVLGHRPATPRRHHDRHHRPGLIHLHGRGGGRQHEDHPDPAPNRLLLLTASKPAA